ncbi:MAG: hypothetical protein HY531_04000 [Chloroflexi bacterium]|nr:hypothetical protein [Chloroflexota bacterium]
MDITFDRGDQSQPRGHAILYYRSGGNILATYVVVLPLKVDFTKYIPPVLASQVKMAGMEEFSAFAIPPVPEEVQSYDYLERLTELRGDDLVFGGEVRENDFLEAAQMVNDAVQVYSQHYQRGMEAPAKEGVLGPAPAEPSVNEIIFSLTSTRDNLGELSKLLGKLQFAVEMKDPRLMQEAEAEIGTLARYLPDNFWIPRLIEVAKQSLGQGSKLARLYLERCYKLADEDYQGVKAIEQAIKEFQDAAG